MSSGPVPIPKLARPAVVLIDAQPGFMVNMAGRREALELRLERLLILAGALELPTLATFERPDVNGWLPAACEKAWPQSGLRLEKRSFDCCRDEQIRAAIAGLDREQLLVAGSETDVCVLQSTLSLLELGYQVFLLDDCVFSSEPHPETALRRMEAAGAVPATLKTAIYELKREVCEPADPAAGRGGWEALMHRLGDPEAWPSWR